MPPPTNTTDQRLTALETKVTALQADMLSVKSRLTAAESSIANLAANKADTTAMIAAIKTATNPLQSAIDALSASKADASAVVVLAASIQSLQDDVSKLEAQVAYLIGVYPPNPNPPQQVAQDITPDFVTFSDQQSGYVFTVVATGGIPDTYTYALTGPDAGLFSIDSVSGDVSAPSPITAGSYDISAEVTNAKGTATFPIGVTTTGDVYETPSEADLPAHTTLFLDARVGGIWHAAAGTDVPGISVGQALGAEPYNVQLAVAGKGPVVIRPPAGNFSISRGAGLTGKTYWIGTKDGNGQPTTVFTGVGSVVTFGWSSTNPNDDCWIKDILIGPTDQQLIDNGITYQQGGRAVQGGGAGRLSLINTVIRNIAEVGLYCNEANEWLTRRSFQCWVYDSEIAGCGTNAQEHNVYFHCGTLAFIRSISRDTRGSHAIKAECEKLIILDSRLVRDTGIGLKGPGNHSAVLNISPACDIRVARNFLQHVDPSTNNISIVETISRGSAGGGFSLKTPPPEDIENDTGLVKTPDGMLGHWASLGFAPGVSKNIEAVVQAAAGTGATSVNLKYIASEGYKSGRNLSATAYTVRFLRSDGARQEITATPTAIGSGTATIPVVGGVGAPGIAVNSPVSIKLAPDTWDYRRVNERFWHKGSVGYWWDAIRSGANLDLTKQDLFNTMYMQDNLYLIQTPANNTQLLQQSTDAPFEYMGSQEGFRANIPFAPINRPGGAGGGWNDVAGYGSWAEPLAGDGYPYYGRNGNVSDFVFRFPIFWADNGVAKLQGGTGEQFDQTVTGGTYDALGDIRWLDSGGALNKVISTDANRNPLPAFVTTTLAAQGNSGSHTATVASIAGLVSGQKFIVDMQAPRGANRTIHITTINGTPSGNTVTMTDAWPMNVPSGSAVSAFTKAGAKPATWIDPSQYSTQ